jgi:hypothetical protein
MRDFSGRNFAQCASEGGNWDLTRRANLSVIMLAAAALADLHAQNGPALNVLYSCNSGRSQVKITRCATSAGGSCDVQFFDSSNPPRPTGNAQLSRDQLLGTLRSCTMPDGRPALGQAPARGVAPSAAKAAAGGPFRVGDTVEVYSLFGWVKVQIVAMRGSALRVCCVDGQRLNVDIKNLRKAHGSSASARFAPDPKPDFGCAGKIDGAYSDDVGALTVTFTANGKAKVTQFSGTFTADCQIRGDRIVLRGPQEQDSVQLTRKSPTMLDADGIGEIHKK